MTEMNRRSLLRLAMVTLAAVLTQALGSGNAEAADKLKAVASFSILGDMLHQVGGDRVEVITLVGPTVTEMGTSMNQPRPMRST